MRDTLKNFLLEEMPKRIIRDPDPQKIKTDKPSNTLDMLQRRFDDVVAPMPRDKAKALQRAKNVGIKSGTVDGQSVVMQPSFVQSRANSDAKDDIDATSSVDLDMDLGNVKSRQQVRLDRIAQERQEALQNATPTTRKNTGYQWSELASAAAVADPRVSSVQDILSTNIPHSQIANYAAFASDLRDAKPEDVQQYLETFKEQFDASNLTNPDPSDVYVRSNNNQIGPPGIIEALNSLPTNDDPKADVMFTDRNGQHQGISIKQTKDATLTNYSIEKMLSQMSERLGLESDDEALDLGDTLRDSRTEVLSLGDDQGSIPATRSMAKAFYPDALNQEGKWSLSQIAGMRDRINKLFGDPNNHYHKMFRQIFSQYGGEIKDQVLSKLFREDLPFDLSQFDGSDLVTFNKKGLFGDGSVDLRLAKNPGQDRGAAKQFLSWLSNGKPQYRGELRHKGDPWSSQQLFMHKDSRFNPWTDE